MSNFKGYLIKFGTQILPNEFMLTEGWSAIPNQRTELDAYRDANNLLHRETSTNFKSKITLTIDGLELKDKIRFQQIINSGMVNTTERKVDVTYWNDETNEYVQSPTGFYIPDITWKIERIDEETSNIFYKSFNITLIEY